MKSILIEENYELHLDITGNEWQQGDNLKGTLKIVNRLTRELKKSKQSLILAHADQKKLKALAKKAFTILENLDLEIPAIKAQGSYSTDWNFQLDENFFITDKKYSPYLFFGDVTKTVPDSLMLPVSPSPGVKKILDTWEVFFRFKIKDIISLKDKSLEVTMIPPATKEFATLDSLVVKIKSNKPNLDFNVTVNIKSLTAGTTGMKINLIERKVEAQWSEKKYLLMPGHLNLEYVQSQIKLLIEACMTKPSANKT